MKPKLLFSLLCAFTLCAALCGFVLSRRNQPSTAADPLRRVFQVRGEVRAVDIPNKTVRVAHEEIPGYMPAMTMPLPVKDASLLMPLNAGDPVQFELSVTENDSWISRITKIAPDGAAKPVISNINGVNVSELNEELQKGELVPDFELTDQNGRKLRLSSFHGKIVLLTFIYTRCPLPNFCPLMSKNFQSLQPRLEKAYPGKFHLLSVSFDPAFDTPEVLKEYAGRYSVDDKSWSFATGPREQIDTLASLFGLVHDPESGLISHNLRTALISPEGRLLHLWKSNVWTPYEVQRRIEETIPNAKSIAAR